MNSIRHSIIILNQYLNLPPSLFLARRVSIAAESKPDQCLVSKNLFGNVEPVIGLEVHAQLNIRSKLFSNGANLSQAPPNSQLDLFDISLPGTLPKLNWSALKAAILTGLGLNCKIQNETHFDRKNYFYSDMPAGFQITQCYKPIAKQGYIDFIVTTYHNSVIAHSQQYDIVKYVYSEDRKNIDELPNYVKRSHIKQIQLEQDSAKTLYQPKTSEYLIDYNRAGAALVEVVFEPDLTNHHEASSLVRELILLLKALDTCTCELQEGSLRVDANVSIKSLDDHDVTGSERVELKNLNSLRALNRGILSEIQRQASMIRAGERVVRESRTYDTKSGKTIALREKEDAVDYRYVPEPNIPLLCIDQGVIERVREGLPSKLPSHTRNKLIEDYRLDLSLVVEILEESGLGDYLIDILSGRPSYDANAVADFLIYAVANLKDVVGIPIKVDLVQQDGEFLQRLTPERMHSLFDMLFADEISFATGYEVMKCIFTSGPATDLDPRQIVDNFKWYQVNDTKELNRLCRQVIGGMKKISKKYGKRGEKGELRMMLEKLCQLTNNRVNVRKAIECFDATLKPPHKQD